MFGGHGIQRPRPAANFDGFWAREDDKEGCFCALVLLDSVEIGHGDLMEKTKNTT